MVCGIGLDLMTTGIDWLRLSDYFIGLQLFWGAEFRMSFTLGLVYILEGMLISSLSATPGTPLGSRS